jgi:hypothetical protein
LGEYGYLKEQDLFYVSGAWSIDASVRKVGVSWWEDEQLSYKQLNEMIELYAKSKPRVVVTHDCPEHIGYQMLKYGFSGSLHRNATCVALQQALESHFPEQWIFGHWHKTIEIEYLGVKFNCLDELDVLEIPDMKW